ncbi:MAG: hypothetical protein EBQ73_00350 [Gammaproteobacteria bacterium]|nr:hypothetical protein [Gammaproteobacteria bacterium]
MAYVYRHIRLDKNEPFYIGIGSDEEYKRANTNTRRNKHWINISKFGYEVDILFDGLTWDEACVKEKEFISLYGRKDKNKGSLCNLTDGGDGCLGRIVTFSEESKRKMSEARKGKKPYIITDEIRKNLSIAAKKRGISKEHLAKMNKARVNFTHRKGIPHTEETRKKMSDSRIGIKKSQEWCKAQSERVTQYWKNKKQKQ